MTKLLDLLRLCAFWGLGALPGTVGSRFRSRWYWARKRLAGPGTAQAFEARLAALGPGSLCLDLGANVGTIAERLAATGATVHAFEPDPWTFGQLSTRLAGRPNVILHNAAIGGADGTLTLMRDPGFAENRAGRSQGTSAHASLLWSAGEPERFEVPQVDIRRFLRDLGQPVDLVKVDIEGAEVDLLEALLDAPERSLVREMFVETHEPQMPALRPQLKALRARVRRCRNPRIHLDWQ